MFFNVVSYDDTQTHFFMINLLFLANFNRMQPKQRSLWEKVPGEMHHGAVSHWEVAHYSLTTAGFLPQREPGGFFGLCTCRRFYSFNLINRAVHAKTGCFICIQIPKELSCIHCPKHTNTISNGARHPSLTQSVLQLQASTGLALLLLARYHVLFDAQQCRKKKSSTRHILCHYLCFLPSVGNLCKANSLLPGVHTLPFNQYCCANCHLG